MTPKVDKEKCIGCGTCVALAGKVFRFDENGKAEVYDAAGEDADIIAMAKDSCPVGAISLEE
jgi:ferredoxin